MAERQHIAPIPPSPPDENTDVYHAGRLDAWRIVITVLLVIGVFTVLVWALVDGKSAQAATYVAPAVGLAGLALGWVFTSRTSADGGAGGRVTT